MKEEKPEGPSCNPGENVLESLFSVDLGLAHSKHRACPEVTSGLYHQSPLGQGDGSCVPGQWNTGLVWKATRPIVTSPVL